MLGSDPRCGSCGAAFERIGPVVNFLGRQFDASPRDPQIAAKMIDGLEEWAREFDALHEPGLTPDAKLAVLHRIGNVIGTESPAATERAIGSVPTGAAINDLRIFLGTKKSARSASVSFLKQHFDAPPGAPILDAGCSIGRHMIEIEEPPGPMVGIDVSTLGLCLGHEVWARTQAGPPPTFLAASILELPFRDASIGSVFSFVVLGLVPLRTALTELHRVLVPGGQLIFTIEGPGFLKRLWDEQPALSARLGAARWWLGRQLLRLGIQWRDMPGVRRLAGLTQYTRPMLEDALEATGYRVDSIETLADYRGVPSLLGVVASAGPRV